ncbi:hypothetical protein A3H53_02885 [Candidatus Nomurabacteria bacterium RIFCSPLOWO2_02_FULL_40_10]|uniref:Peptidase A2 domain-containing protein n=1 Tax=Candidatus Nomurabacteria bacterium RIFCSPLOWO2_02_FULL_40_10 TaxID=1801786 RepID=A0A1F6XZE8_9BACT|nr:MAG: hypothetical protein A3H53_02885 [Candidatus Nomurabacteria bacterium RIFCSPLOWO2_02_FULL_40_10]
MVKGTFVENVPWVKVILGYGRSIQAPFLVLDTGFTGDIQVTSKIATELGLKVTGISPTRIANGQIVQMPSALAIAAMEGRTKVIEVLISDSMPLAGISFLAKFSYKATVDCKNKTVTLERMV